MFFEVSSKQCGVTGQSFVAWDIVLSGQIRRRHPYSLVGVTLERSVTTAISGLDLHVLYVFLFDLFTSEAYHITSINED